MSIDRSKTNASSRRSSWSCSSIPRAPLAVQPDYRTLSASTRVGGHSANVMEVLRKLPSNGHLPILTKLLWRRKNFSVRGEEVRDLHLRGQNHRDELRSTILLISVGAPRTHAQPQRLGLEVAAPLSMPSRDATPRTWKH